MRERDEIERMVRASYAARRSNKVADTLKFFHPDIRFRIAGSEALGPMTRTMSGHADLRFLFENLFPVWDWSAFHVQSVHVDGDTAYVYSSGELTHTPTGKTIETEILDRLVIRDGLIADFVEFLDTQLVADTTES